MATAVIIGSQLRRAHGSHGALSGRELAVIFGLLDVSLLISGATCLGVGISRCPDATQECDPTLREIGIGFLSIGALMTGCIGCCAMLIWWGNRVESPKPESPKEPIDKAEYGSAEYGF
ncbi:MAG: hypothetical protein KR126chlam2_00260 [Chlamydiae bacterium]|nr:hypothetical protein [Chlamydiota bacterium]